MMIAKIRTTVLACAMALLAGEVFAAPVIKGFSSRGGQTQNKTGPKDRMYLARSGDKITFSVKGADACAWFVDKAEQKAKAGSFTWTVPDEKGLWEIRAEADGAWVEWAISNFPKSEAPVIFDYFVDGKIAGRKEKDPWGRDLPEWKTDGNKKAPDVSGGYVKFDGRGENIFLPSNVHLGTWRFRYRYMGGAEIIGYPGGKYTKGSYCKLQVFYMVVGRYGNMNKSQVTCHMVDDGHNWPQAYILDSVTPHICPFADHKLVEKPCARMFGDKVRMVVCATTIPKIGMWGISDASWDWVHKWCPAKLIRTPDGYFRMWKGPGSYPGHNSYFPNSLVESNGIKDKGDTMSMCNKFGFAHDPMKGPRHVELDNVAVWSKQYLWPTKSAVYGKYVHAFHDYEFRSRKPLYRDGITIDGRKTGLADIAAMVKNPAIFKYDAATKTAICKTDLHLQGGSEFVMDGETLKMDCKKSGQLHIRVKNGATIRLKNSTITTTGKAPYRWVFNNEFHNEPVYNARFQIQFAGIFTAEDCTIDNFGGLFMSGPETLVFKNTKFTRMVTMPLKAYCGLASLARWQKYIGKDHAFTLYVRQPLTKFIIQGCTFSAAGKPVQLKLIGMDGFIYHPTLQDCTFDKVTLWAKKGRKYYYDRPFVTKYTDNYDNCHVNLVNVKADALEVIKADEHPAQASFAVKYYLDIKAPAGAKVTVTNETDPTRIPMNLKTFIAWCDEYSLNRGGKAAMGRIGRKMPCTGLEMPTTTVGPNGHTPGPSDAAHTIVLTDYVRDAAGKKEFKYTITVEKGGKKKVITGVNPGPDWYRPDPDKPTQTITVVLDGK
jgi:hypothetical protein